VGNQRSDWTGLLGKGLRGDHCFPSCSRADDRAGRHQALSAYPLSLLIDTGLPPPRSRQGRAVCERRSEPLTARSGGRRSKRGKGDGRSATRWFHYKARIPRKLTSSTMCALHGAGPLLDRPLDLARAAAQAVLQRNRDLLLPRSGPGESLRACMSDPATPPTEELRDWLFNMNGNERAMLLARTYSVGTVRIWNSECRDGSAEARIMQMLCIRI
jgi:hypothetical protein